MKFYRLCRPLSPWGDYSDALIHGGGRRVAGKIEVSRTGPFSPPIFLTRPAIIVTKSFRKSLKASGLTGLSFKPAVKKHVVAIAWEKWDQTAREPKFYPAGGEPDGYLRRKHDQRAADAMEDFLKLVSNLALRSRKSENRIGFARGHLERSTPSISLLMEGSIFFDEVKRHPGQSGLLRSVLNSGLSKMLPNGLALKTSGRLAANVLVILSNDFPRFPLTPHISTGYIQKSASTPLHRGKEDLFMTAIDRVKDGSALALA